MFNYDLSTSAEYCGVGTSDNTAAGWNACPQLPNKRVCRDHPASQRKRHLDRYGQMTELDCR